MRRLAFAARSECGVGRRIAGVGLLFATAQTRQARHDAAMDAGHPVNGSATLGSMPDVVHMWSMHMKSMTRHR